MATTTRTVASTRTAAHNAAEPEFCIEYSKSGRAKCSSCGDLIAKKCLRLGKKQGSTASFKWQHWAQCVTGDTIRQVGSAERLQGLAALKQQDQDAVRQHFSTVGAAPKRTGIATLFG